MIFCTGGVIIRLGGPVAVNTDTDGLKVVKESMMKFLSLAMTLCACFGFNYGLARFFRKRKALYTRMIVFGIGSAFMGRLFETLNLFAYGEIPSGFHIGMLGVVSSFLFFFTANFGQMDSLVDDGGSKFRASRLIALIAPICVAVLYGVYIHYAGFSAGAVSRAIEALVIALASYFHLKHLIIRDIDYGIIRSIRQYNLVALFYAFLCMAEMILNASPFPGILTVIVCILICVVYLVFIPVLELGVKKWTT